MVENRKGNFFRQGYMISDPGKTVRVRLTDEAGYLTIKGISVGATRSEFEYEIPKEDARELLDNFCSSDLTKIRYKVHHNGKLWEVDEFLGDNAGLMVAEIELSDESESFDIPHWVDKEVTGEEKYYNSRLSQNPYKNW